MNDSPNRHTVIVGLFVFLGVAFLLGGIFMVGNMRGVFKDKMEVVSFFDDVNGLKKGNNIWFSGVKIGTVSNLRFYGKSKVEVGMNIEKKSQQYIRKDAEVKISSDGFIGNKILIIYGGTSKSEEVQDGDTLDVEKTFSTEDMINMLQDNNKNFLAITTNFKTISEKLVAGEGTIGKFLNDNSVFTNINNATVSLQNASLKAQQLISSLATFSSGLNTKGTLANELTTDTVVFKSIKASLLHLEKIADTASVFIANLKRTAGDPNTPIGVMLQDKESGTQLKETIKNLASSSKKLDEDLEAAQHNFLLRGYFKNKAKTSKSDSLAKQKN